MNTEPDLSGLVAAHSMIEGARRQRDALVCKLYRQGVPVARMASALGLHRRHLYGILEAHGVERRQYETTNNDAR